MSLQDQAACLVIVASTWYLFGQVFNALAMLVVGCVWVYQKLFGKGEKAREEWK